MRGQKASKGAPSWGTTARDLRKNLKEALARGAVANMPLSLCDRAGVRVH